MQVTKPALDAREGHDTDRPGGGRDARIWSYRSILLKTK